MWTRPRGSSTDFTPATATQWTKKKRKVAMLSRSTASFPRHPPAAAEEELAPAHSASAGTPRSIPSAWSRRSQLVSEVSRNSAR